MGFLDEPDVRKPGTAFPVRPGGCPGSAPQPFRMPCSSIRGHTASQHSSFADRGRFKARTIHGPRPPRKKILPEKMGNVHVCRPGSFFRRRSVVLVR